MSYKCLAFSGQEDFLSNIVHLSNVGSMLGQRRRRSPNIKTALDQCLVWVVSCNQFSGYINAVNLYSIGYCWPTLDRPRHARFEAEWFYQHQVKQLCLAEYSRTNSVRQPYKLSPLQARPITNSPNVYHPCFLSTRPISLTSSPQVSDPRPAVYLAVMVLIV